MTWHITILHKVAHIAHHAEQPLHAVYLGGVVFGGGYKYAAAGMLVCMLMTYLAHGPVTALEEVVDDE
jgi:hypothetical protein